MASKVFETNNHVYLGHIPLQDPLSLAYSVSDIVNIALAYYKIAEDPDEKDHARRIIWNSINEWLEEIAPLRYIPGLIEEIASTIKKKLWDTGIDEKLLEEVFVYPIILRNKLYSDVEPEVLEALADKLSALLEEMIEVLGGNIVPGTQLYDILYGNNEPSDRIHELINLAGLILVLSTNI
jgi:hypothetical protein